MLGYLVQTTAKDGAGRADALLVAVADRLAAAGVDLAGAVQINTDRGENSPCDMDLRVLGDGPVLRISQNLGGGAEGCRLDTGALETAVGLVGARLDAGAELVILNKFGKHEAAGRGFRTAIAQALEADVPVLLAVPASVMPAFQAFAGDLAVPLGSGEDAVFGWCVDQLTARTVDARDLLCPLPVLRLRKRLEQLSPGERVRLEATDAAAVIDVPHFCAQSGHVLLAEGETGDGARYWIVARGQMTPALAAG
ncbi:DUF2478 domain-containing protein [Paracoccus pacificus]|uniref:DUF2478 domain-containing protein n=1 Tax=Paracoccus pacificus TaxID=1463598 RepID=A0ABW4R6K7_9RHOB